MYLDTPFGLVFRRGLDHGYPGSHPFARQEGSPGSTRLSYMFLPTEVK